jgi:hypothetical protein
MAKLQKWISEAFKGPLMGFASRVALGAILATFVSACSSVNLQSAVALGNTGGQTATTYQQAIAAISPGLDNFMEGQYMLAALNRRCPEVC